MEIRSSCEGFRSIISRWSWRVSITVSRVTPAGIGVMVVKIVRTIFATRLEGSFVPQCFSTVDMLVATEFRWFYLVVLGKGGVVNDDEGDSPQNLRYYKEEVYEPARVLT
jgi:hypothetical protein